MLTQAAREAAHDSTTSGRAVRLEIPVALAQVILAFIRPLPWIEAGPCGPKT